MRQAASQALRALLCAAALAMALILVLVLAFPFAVR
jgi:hypothetical protein